MAIEVRYFARLREKLGRSHDRVEITLVPGRALSVIEVWRLASGENEIPPHTLVAVNQNHCGLEAEVSDGDEVAFFPPVTGG